MLTDPYKMTTDELYEELSESYAREAGTWDVQHLSPEIGIQPSASQGIR